jgi:hypothetical protein
MIVKEALVNKLRQHDPLDDVSSQNKFHREDTKNTMRRSVYFETRLVLNSELRDLGVFVMKS